MGPHFFKCGNKEISNSLQIFFEGFNGAALFQVRKPPTPLLPYPAWWGFNGAALFQVRKLITNNIL